MANKRTRDQVALEILDFGFSIFDFGTAAEILDLGVARARLVGAC
jgi:hypothetical protein